MVQMLIWLQYLCLGTLTMHLQQGAPEWVYKEKLPTRPNTRRLSQQHQNHQRNNREGVSNLQTYILIQDRQPELNMHTKAATTILELFWEQRKNGWNVTCMHYSMLKYCIFQKKLYTRLHGDWLHTANVLLTSKKYFWHVLFQAYVVWHFTEVQDYL